MAGLRLRCGVDAVHVVACVALLNNPGIVDIAWSYAFAPVAVFFAATTHGDAVRRWLMAGMVVLWSLRLGTHVCVRVAGHHPEEDVRYSEMRAQWKNHFKWQVLFFYQIQAVLIAMLCLPFLISCVNPQPGLSWREDLGVVIWAVAVAGEALSDWQLKQFLRRLQKSRAGLPGRFVELLPPSGLLFL